MWLIFSLLAALSFGIRGILYQWTSKKPVNRNLMLFGVFAMGAISAAIAAVAIGERWTLVSTIGCLMGFWSFVANASMYKGYAVGKASLVALFTGLPPVVVVCTAYVLWGQTLSLVQLIAFLSIISGILIIRYSAEISMDNMKGVQWAILALLAFGLNDTTATQAMRWDADMFQTMFYMFATGSVLFGASWFKGRIEAGRRPFGAASPARQETAATSAEPVEWRAWPTFIWGMAVGTTNFIGMFFILKAFDLGIAGLVSAVTALNVLIILIYAGIFLKERFTLKEWVGGIFALAGVLTLHLAG
jgi:drug/metabolite transporter (DMT)-like permease